MPEVGAVRWHDLDEWKWALPVQEVTLCCMPGKQQDSALPS